MLHSSVLLFKIVGLPVNFLFHSRITHLINWNFRLIIVIAKTSLFLNFRQVVTHVSKVPRIVI
jgi:hypothetical protein